MTVNRYATQAGKKFEADLTTVLRGDGYDVERLRLAGVEDEGDILLRLSNDSLPPRDRRFVIEAKREKGFHLGTWIKEAEVERDHYADHRGLDRSGVGFVVVHHARGKPLSKSYVTTTLEEWLSRL